MNSETKNIIIENLPKTKNDALKVELVPLPLNDPWRTHGDYIEEQKRNNRQFIITIISLVVSTLGVIATSIVAIVTIRNIAKGNF